MDKKDLVKEKTKIEVVNEMIKLKEVGDTYSDVIRRLLLNQKKDDHVEKQSQTEKLYTGRLVICMTENCDWWGIYQGSAKVHSQKQHAVRERWVQKFTISKENIRGLKEALNGAKRE